MPAKLIDYKVIKGEKCWTYQLKITFNGKKIIAVTITDYYQKKKGRKMITNESILEILKRLNGKRLRPTKYSGKRKVFKWETTYQNKSYRLFLWFKDNTTNHLWIRNCHLID